LALNCQPFTVMLWLFSMSMPPMRFLLIVPAAAKIPAPPWFAPPPSSVTKLEFSTTMPIPPLWMEVFAPVTAAEIPPWREGLMWFRTIPVLELEPFPAMVRLNSVKDLLNDVPSIDTAAPPDFPELIAHGPMMMDRWLYRRR